MIGIPILTAVTDAVWEASLVAAFERGDLGIVVVRRCVDLADLLAIAATRTARAVVLSADLRRLDSEVVSRLSAAGLAVIGVADPGDETATRLLERCGVPTVLATDTPAADMAAALATAVRAIGEPPARVALAYGDPARALRDVADVARVRMSRRARRNNVTGDSASMAGFGRGRVIGVWGPTGAPGRSTLALGVADELAADGHRVLLIDADTYGGSIGQLLGLLEEAPGLVAAVRVAARGALDVAGLASLAREVGPGLALLSGVIRTDRWPELPVDAFTRVLDLARAWVSVVVVDCGFCLEQDEELAYDTLAPRRNGLTLATLAEADLVLAVGAAEPVGLQRLIRGVGDLRLALPDVAPHVVLNRIRRGPVAGDPGTEVAAAIRRHLGIEPLALIPDDRPAFDLAMNRARTVREVAPNSPARRAVADLAGRVASLPVMAPSVGPSLGRESATAPA